MCSMLQLPSIEEFTNLHIAQMIDWLGWSDICASAAQTASMFILVPIGKCQSTLLFCWLQCLRPVWVTPVLTHVPPQKARTKQKWFEGHSNHFEASKFFRSPSSGTSAGTDTPRHSENLPLTSRYHRKPSKSPHLDGSQLLAEKTGAARYQAGGHNIKPDPCPRVFVRFSEPKLSNYSKSKEVTVNIRNTWEQSV